MSMGIFVTANVYCNMTTDDGGWIVIQRNRHWKNIDISYSLRGKEICRTCSHQISFAWPASDIWNSYAPFLYCRTVHLELNES